MALPVYQLRSSQSTKRPSPLRRALLALTGLFIVFILLVSFRNRHDLQDTFSYTTRPLWDKPDGPKQFIPHLHAEGVAANDSKACARHGWSMRNPAPEALVDVFLFSTELELLEIRLRELWDVVDRFVLVESTHTLMGEPKNLTFADNRGMFSEYESKISYFAHQGRPMKPSDDAFTLVAEMRNAATERLTALNLPENSLVHMSDVDEIPSRSALSLLRTCESPLPIHLQMQNFLYSYEFTTDHHSWRAQLHRWGDNGSGGTNYVHGQTSDVALSDSGWHCSYCFRRISEFQLKMKGASHADRLYKRPQWRQMLDPSVIQRKICEGRDLYDMLPEVYSFGDLIKLWKGSIQLSGAVYLPQAVIQDWEKFSFLLPGGCKREL